MTVHQARETIAKARQYAEDAESHSSLALAGMLLTLADVAEEMAADMLSLMEEFDEGE